MIRGLTQLRGLHRYIQISFWVIVVIIIGIYKFFGTTTQVPDYGKSLPAIKGNRIDDGKIVEWSSDRYRKFLKSCNNYESISLGAEGTLKGNYYTLEGLIIMLRHGDRGPLNYVRNVESIDCTARLDDHANSLYENYTRYVKSHNNTYYSQFLGSFHDYPMLPNSKNCHIGQLTIYGVVQLLKLGSTLRSAYKDLINETQIESILVYSSSYRRTIQSVISFLFKFLDEKNLQKIRIKPVDNFLYCFDDCACPSSEIYKKLFNSENSVHFKSHPAIIRLTKKISPLVFTMGHSNKDIHSLKDALYTYICHGAQLPCYKSHCVTPEQVARLFTYTNWEQQQYNKSINYKKFTLLKAYGLIKNILSYLLRIVSDNNSKIAIYSAHDITIQYLVAAFGVPNGYDPPYASRVIFEVYRESGSLVENKRPTVNNYFFRLVFNGRDVTKDITFCKPFKVITSTADTSKYHLCSIESIIRFLHDTYFTIFNSTNFKDSCIIH